MRTEELKTTVKENTIDLKSTSDENPNAGTVRVKSGKNPRDLYPHQIDAIKELNRMDNRDAFSTLLVLPTGAGKTMTAVTWLLTNAVDHRKKILWIAHRHLLLEQAADAFAMNAYSERMIDRQSFKYRIVSGKHDRPIHINPEDDVLVVSKDSLVRDLKKLDCWLEGEKELYLVIDEAHHATARSYRRIIEHVRAKIPHVKLLGLTATPFRTSEQEQGLLGQVFTDDIAYKVDLETLIKRGILSIPICEKWDTKMMLGGELGLSAIKSIERLDMIPEDIAEYIASNRNRNSFIVNTYIENYKKYGRTLVFALNRLHAYTLRALFDEAGKDLGAKAGVIVSGTSSEFIGIDVSNEENARQIEAYRNGEIQVLINVNILTEGVDLPKTQTVFLTRPTISTVLMTQMIGRALRGEKAGGTREANIVSFVDDWNNKIAWVNPESIIKEEESNFVDHEYESKKRAVRLISIAKLEEFARIVNDTVDTSRLEGIDFIRRIPLGMYVFTFIDENNMEHNHQILVYDNSVRRYTDLIDALPSLFEEFGVDEEVVEEDVLNAMIEQCELVYFDYDMIPPYNRHDIKYLLKYFAQKESAPLFVPFEEADRHKVDLAVIAREIKEKDMPPSQRTPYVNALWEDERSLLHVYFDNKMFFRRQLDTELAKLDGDFPILEPENNIIGEPRNLEEMTMDQIRRTFPDHYRQIGDSVYSGAKNAGGEYCCALCGKRSTYKGLFQIDHIFPMSKGGKTSLDNLQLLCRTCNMKKGDQ